MRTVQDEKSAFPAPEADGRDRIDGELPPLSKSAEHNGDRIISARIDNFFKVSPTCNSWSAYVRVIGRVICANAKASDECAGLNPCNNSAKTVSAVTQ